MEDGFDENGSDETGGWLWLDALSRNLRFACRIMRNQPGSTLAVIGILALAIGVTTAVFSLVNALVFTPLPSVSLRVLSVGLAVSIFVWDISYFSSRSVLSVSEIQE